MQIKLDLSTWYQQWDNWEVPIISVFMLKQHNVFGIVIFGIALEVYWK